MGEGVWLIGFVAAQRLTELVFARRNTARLRMAGGVEFGAAHYPFMVALHVSWLIALWFFGHDRPVERGWLSLFLILQAGRLWVIGTLGRRWSTRVIVLPGAPPIASGPYRWLAHPNYLVVALELAVVPLALGLGGIALAFSLANAALLAVRVPVETRALAWAAGQSGAKIPPEAAGSMLAKP
jgi:methyltransferase